MVGPRAHRTPRAAAIRPYVQIARPDHWVKNAFMLLGIVLALFYRPELMQLAGLGPIALAIAVTCLVASSNYVLNEWIDAPLDRMHPVKRERPAARGLIRGPFALAEWLLLGGLGLAGAFSINASFGVAAAMLWIMGCVYNVPPIRTKDVPYLDVLSESVNNPIRLLLGWYALVPDVLPPLSLTLAYWMVGAFLMATKRFAEYRRIGDPEVAAAYRRSFRHYDENKLLVSMMFYVTAGALLSGIFLVRYKLELILAVPVVAGFFSYYTCIALRHDSAAQYPERLHRERGILVFGIAAVLVFLASMSVQIPMLYELFNVDPPSFEPLWHIG